MFQGPVSNSGSSDHIAGQARPGWTKHSASGAPLPSQPPRVLAHNPPPVSRQEPAEQAEVSLNGHWYVECIDGAVFQFDATGFDDARQQIANEAAAHNYDPTTPVRKLLVTTNTGVVDVLDEIKKAHEYRLFAPGERPTVTAVPNNLPGQGSIFTVDWALSGTTSFRAPTIERAQEIVATVFDPAAAVLLPPIFHWSSAEGALFAGLPGTEVDEHDHFAYGDVIEVDDEDDEPFPWDNF